MKKKLVYIIVLLFVFNFTFIFANNHKKDENNNVKFKKIQIEYGDTIWEIAKQNVSGGEDIRNYIYEIMEVNNLETASIHPGKIILVPVK